MENQIHVVAKDMHDRSNKREQDGIKWGLYQAETGGKKSMYLKIYQATTMIKYQSCI